MSSDGEHRLMLAVLKTAIRDYLPSSDRQTRAGRRLSDEVGAWMSRKSPASGVFAYDEVLRKPRHRSRSLAPAAFVAGEPIDGPAAAVATCSPSLSIAARCAVSVT
jgi:hypothetical protein